MNNQNETNKRRGVFLSTLGAALILACGFGLFLGCDLAATGKTASLSIRLSPGPAARSLQPSLDMTVASYDVYGTGPDAASFAETDVTDSSFEKHDLMPGDWTVYAEARNAAGTIFLKSPLTAVTLVVAEADATTITCVPLAGDGTLSVDLSWPATSVDTPVIVATLTPEGGSTADISSGFTIAGSDASYSDASLANGYYTLSLILEDGAHSNHIVWSGVESVLIYKDQTTPANWTLTDDDVDPATST